MLRMKESYSTEAYVNADGYYVISQQVSADEEQVVCFTPEQLSLLVEHMTEKLKDTSWSSLQE